MMNQEGSKTKAPMLERPWTFVLVCALVVVVCSLWLIAIDRFGIIQTLESAQLFSQLETVFSGLAFAAVAYAVILQLKALQLQRTELDAQGREVNSQALRIEKQIFEQTLVQLIGFHHEIARNIDLRPISDMSGQSALRYLAERLKAYIATAEQRQDVLALAAAQTGYDHFRADHSGVLDHYFRNLYHLIKFIDANAPRPQRDYTSLVRAQLAPAELMLLAYNGLSRYGEKFLPLMEKYQLLEQLDDRHLPSPRHKSLFIKHFVAREPADSQKTSDHEIENETGRVSG